MRYIINLVRWAVIYLRFFLKNTLSSNSLDVLPHGYYRDACNATEAPVMRLDRRSISQSKLIVKSRTFSSRDLLYFARIEI